MLCCEIDQNRKAERKIKTDGLNIFFIARNSKRKTIFSNLEPMQLSYHLNLFLENYPNSFLMPIRRTNKNTEANIKKSRS